MELPPRHLLGRTSGLEVRIGRDATVSHCRLADVHDIGGGGFVDGFVFNPSAKGVAFARTDIGGAYRLNSDDSWTPLQDWVNNTNWLAGFLPSRC